MTIKILQLAVTVMKVSSKNTSCLMRQSCNCRTPDITDNRTRATSKVIGSERVLISKNFRQEEYTFVSLTLANFDNYHKNLLSVLILKKLNVFFSLNETFVA